MFTSNSEIPINGMMSINTVSSTPHKLTRLCVLAISVGMLALSPFAQADEENEAAADHIIAAEEALNEQRYQDASREYRIAATLSADPQVAQKPTRIA